MATASHVPSEEYETQFFGFSPSTFFEEVKAIINDRLCEGTDHLEQKLQEIPERVLPRDEITRGVETLRQHTESNFSKTMQKLESHILVNLMKIPSHILLPSDVEQATQVSSSDISLLQAEIDSLHMQLKNEKYMQAKYKEELQDIRDVLGQQQKLKNDVLGNPQIAYAEDLKEKLMFIQANQSDTKLASSKLQEVIKNIPMKNIQSPAEILSQNAME